MSVERIIALLMLACLVYSSLFEHELLKLIVHKGIDISDRAWILETPIHFQIVYSLMVMVSIVIPAYLAYSFLEPHKTIFKDMFKEDAYGLEKIEG